MIDISAAVTIRKFKKHDIIVQQGDEANEFFIIKSGSAVAVIAKNQGSKKRSQSNRPFANNCTQYPEVYPVPTTVPTFLHHNLYH